MKLLIFILSVLFIDLVIDDRLGRRLGTLSDLGGLGVLSLELSDLGARGCNSPA